jgi:hypothetical protein
VSPRCLDLAREALAGYTVVRNPLAVTLEDWIAARIQRGIEDDISDLRESGRITPLLVGKIGAPVPIPGPISRLADDDTLPLPTLDMLKTVKHGGAS